MDRLEEIKRIYKYVSNEGAGKVEDIHWLISKIEQLKKNFDIYGWHLHDCNIGQSILEGTGNIGQMGCTCGYLQALKEGG